MELQHQFAFRPWLAEEREGSIDNLAACSTREEIRAVKPHDYSIRAPTDFRVVPGANDKAFPMNIQSQGTVSLPISGSRGAVNPQFHKPAFRVPGSRSRRSRVLELRGRHLGPDSETRERALQSCGSNGPRRILIDLLTRVECIEAELAAMQITVDDAKRLVGG